MNEYITPKVEAMLSLVWIFTIIPLLSMLLMNILRRIQALKKYHWVPLMINILFFLYYLATFLNYYTSTWDSLFYALGTGLGVIIGGLSLLRYKKTQKK